MDDERPPNSDNEADRIMSVIRMAEEQRTSLVRTIFQRCELWMVLMTAIPWLILWALVLNFYPTEAVLTILKEMVMGQ